MSDGVTVTIKGLDKFDAMLDRMGAVARGEKILQALQAGAYIIMTYAAENARQKLNKHPTGNLVNSLGVRTEGRNVLVGVFGVVYAKIHEFGGVITPIKAKALHFVIDGKHITTQRVVIPARPYLTPAVDEHMPEIEQAVSDTMAGLLSEAL